MKMTITSRDVIPFTIEGTGPDLCTVAMVLQSGFQAQQNFKVAISEGDRHGYIHLSNVHGLAAAVNDLVNFIAGE